jgi:ribosomal-protein-alanine N-acetyltransferase
MFILTGCVKIILSRRTNMRIETERMIIRSIERGDEKEYLEMSKDGSLTEIGFDETFSRWTEDWINEALEQTENDNPRKDFIPCTIVLKETGEIIGNVGCTFFEDTNRIGICYFIGSDHKRHGYVTEAIKGYVKYFFDHYSEDEIIAVIKDENLPSWKTAEKVGFKLEETKMYKDIGDDKEELYRFYQIKRE